MIFKTQMTIFSNTKSMKSTKPYFFLAILSLLCSLKAIGQQDPNYTFYRYAMNLINPAYAGASEQTMLGLNVRSQWASVEGAPETQSVFFGTSITDKVGLGISVINDQTFIEDHTSVSIDFSYRVQLSRFTNLFFGLKAGANSYNVNTQGLSTFSITADPSLSNIDGRFTPNIGFGALLKGTNYFLSFSVPKILSPERIEDDNGTAILGTDRVHFYLAGGYDFELGGNLTLKPSVLTRYVDDAPFSLDLTTALQFNTSFEIGAAYRWDEGIGGFAVLRAQNWLNIGYAYESPLNSEIADNNGTHEIYTRFIF